MKAEEARKLADSKNTLKVIINQISNNIESSAEKGLYECEIELPESCSDKFVEVYKKDGYELSLVSDSEIGCKEIWKIKWHNPTNQPNPNNNEKTK